MSKEQPFESQSITIIENLMEYRKLSREQAMRIWFGSKTYKEILRRNLTYISAMRALHELDLEYAKSPDWMDKSFE